MASIYLGVGLSLYLQYEFSINAVTGQIREVGTTDS